VTALLELSDIRRSYPSGDGSVEVLKGISLRINAGEMVAIVGASGSGKSTLMNIIGCLDKASSGTYRVAGTDVATLDADALARLRREHFGFIFQRYHLLSHLSATQNVEIPAVYAGTERRRRLERARALLAQLGLEARRDYRPSQLSGGQQQRVSIARALMNGGQVILADEPTGALDSRSGEEVMAILGELHAEGHTIIIVTHDMSVAEHAQRIIEIRDGEIIADRRGRRRPEYACGHRRRVAAVYRRLSRGAGDGLAGTGGQQDAHPADHAGDYHRHRLGGLYRGGRRCGQAAGAGRYSRHRHQHHRRLSGERFRRRRAAVSAGAEV